MLSAVVCFFMLGLLTADANIECNPEWSISSVQNELSYQNTERVSEPADLTTLKLVHVILRHGARTPDLVSRYPTDPYFNETFYPTGYGQLTIYGKQQEFRIGKALRERYDTFLGDIYVPGVLEANSTDYDRTKNSLELVLAGLWPPVEEQVWNDDLPWQPIPYHYKSRSHDIILTTVGDACPKFQELYQLYLESEIFKQQNDQLKDFYDYVADNTGLNTTIPEDIYNLYFTLFAEEQIGFPLPEWTKCVWPDMMTNVAIQYYYTVTSTIAMKQYTTGIILKTIFENAKKIMDGTLEPEQRKIYVYSGHELNIAMVLLGLNLFQPHVPPYASHLLFELHEIQGIYGFKIFYQDYEGEEPSLLKIPGCDSFCPLNEFYEIIKDILPCCYC